MTQTVNTREAMQDSGGTVMTNADKPIRWILQQCRTDTCLDKEYELKQPHSKEYMDKVLQKVQEEYKGRLDIGKRW